MTNPSDHSAHCVAAAFADRARTAGHPVLQVGPGRWTQPDHYPHWEPRSVDGDLTPNDRLDAARDAARARVDWIHAVMPTAADAVRLGAAVQPAVPAVRRSTARPGARSPWRELLRRPTRTHRGDPRQVPFAVLVAEIPLSVVTLTNYRAGHAVHVVEIPAPWLTHPLNEVTSR